jgi:drug/metabolite transporter (DMT)-like permease
VVAASFLYQAAGIAFASYAAWFWLVSRYSASRLAAFSFLTPIFGVLAGALLLGERLGSLFALAVLLVAAGLWLVNRPAR